MATTRRRPARRRRGRGPAQGGFTVIEVMIALTILLIGIAGLLSMQLTALRATSFSRHATEASMLAEDKMEALRTEPIATLTADSDVVDARGLPDPAGLYTRTWTPSLFGDDTQVEVQVSWQEQGGETFTITMTTVRDDE